MKRVVIHIAVASVLTGVISAGILYIGYSAFQRSMTPLLLDWLLLNLSEEERQQLVQEVAADTAGLFDAAPEPLVAKLGKRDFVAIDDKAEIRLNNAGMRSSRPYTRKAEGVFRIVCLGDSMVFGHAGREEDRFCDQMEQFYGEQGIRVGGRRIELYALGLDSWTTVQEATYLSSRISAYDPDVVVVLTTSNDITDADGITGSGRPTQKFSPEQRDWGSAVFTNNAGLYFGARGNSAVATDLSPEGRARWHKAISALGGLVDLQRRRGKQVLLAVLEMYASTYFTEIYKHQLHELEIEAPYAVIHFARSRQNRLPHDGHPNRLGHAVLMSHFVRVLDALDWVPLPKGVRPALHEGQALEISPPPDASRLERERRQFADDVLRTSLDFRRLGKSEPRGILGGILPGGRSGARARAKPPWASVRSGFLLGRPGDREPEAVTVDVRIPPLVELFPMRIDVRVNGRLMRQFAFDEPSPSNRYELTAPVPPLSDDDLAIEVVLEADSYFTEIVDPLMKSFRLLSASVR